MQQQSRSIEPMLGVDRSVRLEKLHPGVAWPLAEALRTHSVELGPVAGFILVPTPRRASASAGKEARGRNGAELAGAGKIGDVRD